MIQFVRQFDVLVMLEPDVRLIREGWMDAWATQILGNPNFYVLGSAVRGTGKPFH